MMSFQMILLSILYSQYFQIQGLSLVPSTSVLLPWAEISEAGHVNFNIPRISCPSLKCDISQITSQEHLT